MTALGDDGLVTFKSSGLVGRAVRGGLRRAAGGCGRTRGCGCRCRRAGGWRGRWGHDVFFVVFARALRVAAFLVARMISEPEPRRVRGLDCGVVPQCLLARRREAKLCGQLPEAGGDTRELVGDRVRPAQVVDRLGFNRMQVNESHEKYAVRVQKRPEMWPVEPGCVFLDPPHDSPDALVTLADFTARGSRSGSGDFCRGSAAHVTILAGIRTKTIPHFTDPTDGASAFSRRRAWRRSRLASTLALRRASRIRASMFIPPQ